MATSMPLSRPASNRDCRFVSDDKNKPDENKLIAERRSKLDALREQGNPFPNDFRRDAIAEPVSAAFPGPGRAEPGQDRLAVGVPCPGHAQVVGVERLVHHARVGALGERVHQQAGYEWCEGREDLEPARFWALGDRADLLVVDLGDGRRPVRR